MTPLPDFVDVYRDLAALRVRLAADAEPLTPGERAVLVQVLNSFEGLMVGCQALQGRLEALDRQLADPGEPA